MDLAKVVRSHERVLEDWRGGYNVRFILLGLCHTYNWQHEAENRSHEPVHFYLLLKGRGRDVGYPTPPTDPGVRHYRTGLLDATRFRHPRCLEQASPCKEVGLGAPALLVRPAFPMKAASHRHPPS